MQNKAELLRQIPKVDDLLNRPLIHKAAEGISHVIIADAIRETLDHVRLEIQNGTLSLFPEIDLLESRILSAITLKNEMSLRPVINGTGIILHTNLGRAPLSQKAIEAVCSVAGSYSTLEYNVAEGVRGSRYSHVEKLLCKLIGCEDALVVNNNAAAVLLILSTLTKGREVVISRGELVEIGGSFRVPDIMQQSGGVLVEVGTTNKTRLSDYEGTISEERTAALLKVHTSNFKIMGFTEEAGLSELAALAQKHHIPLIYDLGSGALFPLEPYGIANEPTVLASMRQGVDVLSFSGDKLLGGPQAGIILGKKEYIAAMKKNPLTRAIRIDKLTLAALEATLRHYLDPEEAMKQIPAMRMLSYDMETLRGKAKRLCALIEAERLPCVVSAENADAQMGGGSVPTQMLPSMVCALNPETVSVTTLEERLRHSRIPVIGRIYKDRLLLDMRTVDENDFPAILEGLRASLV